LAGGVADALQGASRRLRKIHPEAVVAQVAPKLLAKQHLDIGLVVNNENKRAVARLCVVPVMRTKADVRSAPLVLGFTPKFFPLIFC